MGQLGKRREARHCQAQQDVFVLRGAISHAGEQLWNLHADRGTAHTYCSYVLLMGPKVHDLFTGQCFMANTRHVSISLQMG